MAEEITVDLSAGKAEKYEALFPQIEALIEPEKNLVANLANIAAVLHTSFGNLWTGFYFVREDELVLGPFQGPVACTRFPITKGVCGASVQQKSTIIVPDVDAFPGHIACSSLSRSEIVVPMISQNEVKIVLDLDSSELNQYDEVDQEWLEKIMRLLARHHFN